MSADILACGGSSLFEVGFSICFKHVLNNATNAVQCRSADFVSRMHESTLVTQISTTD